MSKKISITLDVEVEDDDYEDHYKEELQQATQSEMTDLVLDWLDWEVPLTVSSVVTRGPSNVIHITRKF